MMKKCVVLVCVIGLCVGIIALAVTTQNRRAANIEAGMKFRESRNLDYLLSSLAHVYLEEGRVPAAVNGGEIAIDELWRAFSKNVAEQNNRIPILEIFEGRNWRQRDAFVDVWHQPLHILISPNQKGHVMFQGISGGPDQKYESGRGDDVVVEYGAIPGGSFYRK